MTWFLDTGLVSAAVGLAGGAFVPAAIARVPEPPPEDFLQDEDGDGAGPPPGDGMVAAEDEADFARPLDDPKEPYAEVAALPGLRWKSALASAVALGLVGARIGWDPVLLAFAYLVPLCVALTVVDWRTRFLPTPLIAPSYAVVGVLLVLASLVSGDWHALLVAVIGWVVTFVLFFAMWWIYPSGLGYGDVRLSGLLAMPLGWLGVGPLVLGIYTGFVLGAIGGTLLARLRVFHRKHYPFGPFMVLGAWLGVVAASGLGLVYGWVINGLVAAVLAVVDAFG